MISSVASLRVDYGANTFVSKFDDLLIAWRPLSIEEYQYYSRIFAADNYPFSFLEDEIFRKCVASSRHVARMGELPAGVVSTVVSQIFRFSGPSTLAELRKDFETKRLHVASEINELLIMITTAFPAYKPNELRKMTYEDLMTDAALAERKLLQLGMLQHPLYVEKEEPKKRPKQRIIEKLMSEQRQKEEEKQQEPTSAPVPQPPPSFEKPKIEPLKIPTAPLPYENEDTTVISATEMNTAELNAIRARNPKLIAELEETARSEEVYGDYLKQIAEGKTVKIKSAEERIAEAKVREEKNKEKFNERMKEIRAHRQTHDERISQLFEKASRKHKR